MKEEMLEQGEAPVQLNLLAQQEEQQQRDHVVRIQDVAANARAEAARLLEPMSGHWDRARDAASGVMAPASRVLAPARRALSPMAGVVAPLAAMCRTSFLPKASGRPSKLRKTAYLDGMRGFAALLVYCLHHQLWAKAFYHGSDYLENSFGYDGTYVFAAFYGIRTFFSGGHFAVATFFVLSGYVLSTKPLSLINKGEYLALGDNVSSALFRRWLRLYLPIIIVTFFVMASPHVTGIRMSFEPQKTLKDEIWKWYCDCKNMFFIYDTGNRLFLDYQPHVWSIPVEFKGSILVYTSLMAFSRMTRTARLCCEAFLWYYLMYIVDGAHYAMFMGGMIICDLEMAAEEDYLPRWIRALEPYKTYIFYAMFVIAIWWGGVPAHTTNLEYMRASPGWYYLSFLKPQAVFDFRWFFLFWAASFMVASTPHIPWLKRFFETRFCQHLGRISYMLYLMHGPVLWTLGDRLYAATGWTSEMHVLTIPNWMNAFPLPKWGPFGLEISFILPNMILMPLTLWVAEIMTTLVDDSSIKFTQWLYKRMLPEKPAAPSTSQSEEKTSS